MVLCVITIRKRGTTKNFDVRGAFIEIDYVANSDLVANLVELNKRGEVVVDEHRKTNVPGIFAAGGVSNIPYKQIIVAAGEGDKAALSAYEYLSRLREPA
jgi:alkyl hydroperoxide reductase subunit AhpF